MFADFDPLDLKPGQKVSDWLIVRRIGRGGYAVVYEVEKDGQRFALKLACQTERSLDPKQTDARARREAACLQQLNHQHIIRMVAQGRWPGALSGFHYIVLEFVDGYTLARWVERTHPTPHEVVVLFLKLFDALEHMHARGVFHRDLSLRNIMVTLDGEPVIIDFGAADYTTAEELTDGPLPPGTPRNRSPEAQQFWEENRHKAGARYTFKATDDIFALGANLYDVLTNPTPTRGETRPLLGNSLMDPPTPHRATQGRVPVELSAYAMRLIHRDLEVRPATAKDARRPLLDLRRLEGDDWRQLPVHLPVQVTPADAAPGPSAAGAAAQGRQHRKGGRPVFVGLLVLSLLATGIAASLLHRSAQPEPAPNTLAEKPTSHPTRLPSSLPTQKEASPSVKLSDNSPTHTHGVPNPQQTPKASKRRALSKAERCALLVASVAWLEAGCAGVQTRPEPEPCPKEAIKAMRELGWELNTNVAPFILLDVTKGSAEEARTNPDTVWKDGPVTGELIEPEGKAPAGMRIDGHLWTTGDRIYGRYVRAHLPDGRTVPICVELTDGSLDRVGMDKLEGSKPGAPLGKKVASTSARRHWR